MDVVCVVEEHCCVSGEAGEETESDGEGEEIWLVEVSWLGLSWPDSMSRNWTSFPASVIPRFLPGNNFPPPILRTSVE